MRDYVIAAFGQWDEATERRLGGPDLSRIAVVSIDDRDVGMVEARVDDGELYLANIQVSPPRQGHGLGGSVVGPSHCRR